MSEKKSFIMYMDQRRLINKLTDEEAGRLLKAIYEYQATGECADLPPAADMLFGVICNQLDRDNEKWARTVQRRAEAGRAGGRAKAENSKQMLANASKSKQTLANLADNDNDNVNDNESDSENENVNDNESAVEARAVMPPSASPSNSPTDPSTKKPRGHFGHVLLTDEEVEDFKKTRPDDWEIRIEHLDRHLEENPAKQTWAAYSDHLAILKKWAKEDDAVPRVVKQQPSETSVHFDLESLNKGKYGDIFMDLFSDEAEEYIKGGNK